MLRLLEYFKKIKWQALCVLLLLFVQAWCDLSLPQYTSDIVDVGIQQGGIEYGSPRMLRPETLEDLLLFLEEEEADFVRGCYEERQGVLCRKEMDGQTEERLTQTLDVPMLAMSIVSQLEMVDMADVRLLLSEEYLTPETIRSILQEIAEEYGEGQLQMYKEQWGVSFLREEYAALGVDLEAVQTDYLLSTGGKMLLLAVVLSLAAILVGLLAARAAARVGHDLRQDVFAKVVSFSSAEMDRFSTASLITRSTNDIQQVQMVVVLLLRMVLYAPIIGVGGILRVAETGTGMEWIIALAVGIALGLVWILMQVAMPKFRRMQELIDRVNLVSREILTGLPVIRAFSREEHEKSRFDRDNRALMGNQLFTGRVMAVMMPTMTLLMNGIAVLIVWNGGHGVDAGDLQVGDLIAFITYTMQIVMAFLMIAAVSIFLPRAQVAARRLGEVLDTVPSVRDPEEPRDGERDVWRGEVCFEDVSFRYPDAGENVLEHVSFTARPGETTAIIGSTGAGKSTLLNLIPRFFDVSGGRITVDGVDVREMTQGKLRSLLGYVPQKGVLFSGTIESNLKYSGEEVTDGAMIRAAAIAQAEEFIADKEEGYASPIAQGGSNVSGGQKQRLSIARAVAKDPKIFLFDDSFSALDYKTDAALRKALRENVGEATVIIVAQRISTVLHAEQIVVLDEGKVAGIGSHESLLKTCPTYREIARSQLSAQELGGVEHG